MGERVWDWPSQRLPTPRPPLNCEDANVIRFTSIANYQHIELAQIVQPAELVPVPPKPRKPRKICTRRKYDRAELQHLRDEGWGYIRIGRLYDKHHTTILYACRKWGIK